MEILAAFPAIAELKWSRRVCGVRAPSRAIAGKPCSSALVGSSRAQLQENY